MPAPSPFPSPFPALYLYPLNDSFIPKHISLLHNQHVKIGRQTNAKTTPGERNGYFDSKVLSRQHAEVWEEGNKIFIKDVKSSNGTFINGERLSPEGLESDPFQLKSDDIVEFGIDIVGEDNKTIVHHKVAARVVCIFSEQDAQMAARAEQHQMQQHMQAPPPNAGNNSNGGNNFNFAGAQPARRPPMTQQGISGMGGMGGSMRPPGKSGLTFDHILNRLQGELEKSRETGAELHTLTGAMNEIHDTLGGGSTAPSFPHSLPSVRPASPDPLTDLQSQLKDTQTSLSQHIDRIRVLEDALKEQEAIRHEVRLLRDLVEARREDDDDTDDDARSVDTVVPHELESVEEEEEDDHSLGRPRTPEPSSLGMVDSRVDDLTTRLTTLSVQLESALTLSSTLQAQHSTAQSTISALETKVQALESLVKDTILAQQQQPPAPVAAPAPVSTELTTMINEWKKSVQGQWSNVQEEWAQERERLGRAREEWESKVRLVDDSLERMEQMQRSHDDHAPPYRPNGHVHGLVTPPSPRSLSSDSNRPRRKRRGRSGSGGSRRRASEERSDTEDTEATLASEAPSSEHTKEKDPDPVWALATPAPSIASMANGELAKAPDDSTHTHPHPSVPPTHNHHHNLNMGAAVGVVLLSVAAAAVVWKVKPGNV